MANVPKGKKSSTPAPKKGILSNLRPIELGAIGIFILAILLYAISKCGGSETAGNGEGAVTITNSNGTTATNPNAAGNSTAARPLYVIIDSLKLRKGPHLDSALVQHLLYGAEVYDLGKRSTFEQTIKISAIESRTAPWVQIRTYDNKVGWVFGGGLEYYPPKKRANSNPVPIPTPATTVTQPNAPTVTGANAATTTGGR